jgi:F0F1-type ATP synthase delta subunit
MKDFISCLLDDNLLEAKEILVDRIEELISEKLESLEVEIVPEVDLDEGNIQRMGRTKLIRVRIRKGKIQRRVKKAAVKGYTIRSGRLVRMTPMEKRHRKMAARRSKFKRRSKLMQSMRKRNISIRKRKGLGLQ